MESGVLPVAPELSELEAIAERFPTTESMAARLGKSVPAFRMWVRRRGVQPVTVVRFGSARIALWDLERLLDLDAREQW